MVYRLQDVYDYQLPELPPEEEILFHDLQKEKQHWQHPNFNYDDINKKWTDEKKIAFVKRELTRRRDGIWFYNNGEPTYITGSHYFFLVYYKVPVEKLGMTYPLFRRYQKELFYFLDLVDKDKYCEGAAISKPRRVGCTAMINSDIMNLSMLRSDKLFSIQNKKLDEAQRYNYAPIKYNIEHHPSIKLSNGKEIFIPKIGNLLNRRMKWGIAVRDKDSNSQEELNNQIYIVPTVQNADDGGQAHRLIRDEPSKYDAKINISTMLAILRPVAQTGTEQVGKILFFCTSDVEDTPNFEEWKKIIYGSDYTLREKRKTKTGLYKYFISARYSVAGEVVDENDNEVQLFNIFGECDEDLAIEWVEDKKRDARLNGDLKTLQEIRRNYPIFEADAFDSGLGSACFDVARLSAQLYEIEKKEKKVLSGIELPFYTIGDFIWVVIDREVIFVPNPYGHWWVYHLPTDLWKNKNSIDRYNFLCPDDTSPYLWSCDPFAYREMVMGGSKGGIVIGSSIDSSLPGMGGILHARYNHRPNNPNDFLEEVRKAIIFYSASGLPENNKEWVAMHLLEGKDDKNNNRFRYGRFMLIYENGKFRRWRPGDKIAGINNQQKSIEAYVRDCAIYLREPKNETEFDYLKTIWDKETIKQLMVFNPTDTTKTDLAVTFEMYTMVLKNFNRIVQQDNGILTQSQIIKSWFRVKNTQKLDPKLTRIDISEMV